jgi:hypothetical protein
LFESRPSQRLSWRRISVQSQKPRTTKCTLSRDKSLIAHNQAPTCFGPSGPLSGIPDGPTHVGDWLQLKVSPSKQCIFLVLCLRLNNEIQGNTQRSKDFSCSFQKLQTKFRDNTSTVSQTVPCKTSLTNHLTIQYYIVRVTGNVVWNIITASALREWGKPLNPMRTASFWFEIRNRRPPYMNLERSQAIANTGEGNKER